MTAKLITSPQELEKQLLVNRQLKTALEIERFFNPRLAYFTADLKIAGIKKAQERINQAIKKGELIIIFGDYDADGICGTAVLYHALTALGAKVLPIIPHREKDGYGLSVEGVKKAQEKGGDLLITVDNGIVAHEAASFAKKEKIDLIVTDHHVTTQTLPEAKIIIHSTNMSGAAVAWTVIKDLLKKDLAEDLLELVAIATVCDLVPLLGVNRSLVKIGLEKLNQTKRVGLLALFQAAGLTRGQIDTYQIGFMIGPRLNAVGRLEDALDALRLLCTKEPAKAAVLAKRLERLNGERKLKTDQAIMEAKTSLQQKSSQKLIILSSNSWHPGIIGLVAGKITEEFSLPAIIIAKGEEISRGSARSLGNLNIIATIRECAGCLLEMGGHEKAAGFTIETAKIALFEESLNKVMAQKSLKPVEKIPTEGRVDLQKISLDWLEVIAKFAPFGIGNLRPILESEDVSLSAIKTVGNGKHLKFQADGLGCIAFSQGQIAQGLDEKKLFNLTYYLEEDNFNNYKKIQLKILNLQTV